MLVTGSFNAWGELIPLSPQPAAGGVGMGHHALPCCLPPGSHQFQFLVDGAWLLSPAQPTTLSERGHLVNRLVWGGWGGQAWGGIRGGRRCGGESMGV